MLGKSIQSHLYLLFEIFEMDYLFESAEFVGFDFVQSQEALSPPAWQFDGLDLLLGQSVLSLVLFDLSFAFLLGRVVAGVDDEIIFSGHSRFLHIILENLLQVQMQSHEITQRLLSEQSLSLHVDLCDGFTREAFGVDYFFPFADTEFHQG